MSDTLHPVAAPARAAATAAGLAAAVAAWLRLQRDAYGFNGLGADPLRAPSARGQQIPAPPAATAPAPRIVGTAAFAGVPPSAPSPPPVAERAAAMAQVRADLGDCQRCKLAPHRTSLVFGNGALQARLMFIGEAPGANEDLQGQPFVGAAGKLLDRMIAAMGLRREEVYVSNLLKCRPPRNRDPEPDEVQSCSPFLRRQVAVVGPTVLVALGRFAAQALLEDKRPISKLRGTWQSFAGIPLMPTFHPAYLLHNPAEKKKVWADLQQVMQRLDLCRPGL